MSGPAKRREDALPLERVEGPPLSRRKVHRRAQEVGREAVRILKARGRFGLPGAVQATGEAADELEQLLAAPRDTPADVERLHGAVQRLDRLLEEHFAKYRKSTAREYLESILWAVGLAAVIRFFLIEPFSIPSGSMIPTLEIGDKLFVNKIKLGLFVPLSAGRLVHWSEPKRGDIIVFEFRKAGDRNDGEDYIKRVVAIPGDRVRLEDNRLWLNGKPIEVEDLGAATCDQHDPDSGEKVGSCPCGLQRERIPRTGQVGDPDVEVTAYETQHHVPGPCQGRGFSDPKPDWPAATPPGFEYFGDRADNPHWPDVVIPEGHVLAFGDNRDQSQDGRYWGLVPFDRVKGTAFLNWWPPSRMGILE
jgi:signal peptidase I